jgi:hypothetical protein
MQKNSEERQQLQKAQDKLAQAGEKAEADIAKMCGAAAGSSGEVMGASAAKIIKEQKEVGKVLQEVADEAEALEAQAAVVAGSRKEGESKIHELRERLIATRAKAALADSSLSRLISECDERETKEAEGKEKATKAGSDSGKSSKEG